MSNMAEENGWNSWQNLVLDKLKKNDESHTALNETLLKIHTDIATLKTGARISGALAGFLAGAVITIAAALIKFIK
jgi:hypothetical protein